MLRRREQLLTVDCTAYRAVQLNQKDRLTVKYNINIPAFVVHNPDLPRNALERVRVLLETDFNPTDQIDYQITGMYVTVVTLQALSYDVHERPSTSR
jgi:hypothetical protein